MVISTRLVRFAHASSKSHILRPPMRGCFAWQTNGMKHACMSSRRLDTETHDVGSTCFRSTVKAALNTSRLSQMVSGMGCFGGYSFAISSSAIAEPSKATAAAATAAAASPAAPMVGESLVSFLQVGAPLACQVVFLAPMQAMRDIKRNGTTGEMTAMPYSAMLTNCVLWTLYGVLKSDPTIILPNASGIVFASYYVYTFSRYATGSMLPHYGLIGGSVASALAVATLLPTSTAINLVGFGGMAMCVTMFAGPLAVIRVVLRDRSCESMHLGFTLAGLVNCSMWSAYGFLVIHDPYIWGPNFAGLVFSCIQAALFARFGTGTASAAKKL